MKSPQFSVSKLPSASEYALIVGAGAGAAMSIAAQQVAVASLPITTLVALGLLNRYRLDQRLSNSELEGQSIQAISSRTATSHQVTTQPQPEASTPQLRPVSAAQRSAKTTPPTRSLGHPGYSPDYLRAARDEQAFVALQKASLQKIGAYLQQVRQEKALSLQDVYDQTFLQPYTIKAIEVGELRSLPEPFYIRAFIQKYASILGLKGSELAAEFPVGQSR
ncbi:MAG: helix-turn-helix domain-containing protein [Nodosilinea sp.]